MTKVTISDELVSDFFSIFFPTIWGSSGDHPGTTWGSSGPPPLQPLIIRPPPLGIVWPGPQLSVPPPALNYSCPGHG